MRRSPRPPAPGQTRFGELREMVGPLVLQVEEHKALLKDLEEAAAILRKHSDNPRIQGALERVDRSLRRVQDWKKRFSWAQRGYEFFGDPKNPNTILEGLRGDLGPKSIERILEVVGEGKGRREFEKIMKKEFPELIFEFVEDHLDISKEELLERLESKSDDDDDEEDDDDDDDEEKGGRRR